MAKANGSWVKRWMEGGLIYLSAKARIVWNCNGKPFDDLMQKTAL